MRVGGPPPCSAVLGIRTMHVCPTIRTTSGSRRPPLPSSVTTTACTLKRCEIRSARDTAENRPGPTSFGCGCRRSTRSSRGSASFLKKGTTRSRWMMLSSCRRDIRRSLHGREELIAGGVSAAFSVKLTATAAGLEDAVDRARRLRRGLLPRFGTPRAQIVGPYAIGLLCHSHGWTQPGSTPAENVRSALEREHF